MNLRFNRLERGGTHVYLNEYGHDQEFELGHEGYIKCKLVHLAGRSIIAPDFLLLGGGDRFIQPLAFSPCILMKTDDSIHCQIFVDISGARQVQVRFTSTDLVRAFDDGSELYRCMIYAHKELADHATGTSSVEDDGSVFIDVFHHTTADARAGILADGSFRLSAWNIRGNKKLANVGYVYFTPLDQIVCDQDLHRIGMASDGEIILGVDDFVQPPFLSPAMLKERSDEILCLDVYRESTLNRRHTLSMRVDASLFAPSHLWFHSPAASIPYYEVASPHIYRVGLKPGAALPFTNSTISPPIGGLKSFEYAVIGDARTVPGLAAPFDEEETTSIFKIQRVSSDSGILQFWFEESNRDHFSKLTPELQEFVPEE